MSARLRPLFDGMPTPVECLAILTGLAEVTVFGLGAFANTIEYAKGYGLPSNTDDEKDQQTPKEKALVSAVAARNLQHGVLVLALACYARDRRALGLAFATGLVTSAADIITVRTYGVQDLIWGHVFGALNFAGLAAGLLYWQATDPWW
ncbi:Hypothetical protein R9X50_00608500 [Acrodontium crateriforme]|uniref:DUF4267 domain-containing protein n=1 Tax=Acrodontium crateriforme TaxID=150365 RepID=A0AAQ3RDH0_9PEZI|nr:Hypothetical protein R9X50_00608500 [Acrodontium crateriforme]